jgi:AICAR transformylase/IMP cyclohydrolase PurH
MSSRKPIRRALISVYDKSGLIEIGSALSNAGIEILSTGSTAKNLAAAGIPVIPVEEYTGFPEIMGGRVKTLHPRIHGGILADQNNPQHLSAITEQDIAPFDLVIINLYPFAQTIATTDDFAQCIEQIDIGGPSMLRGAAKNHGSVAVISDPSQYPVLIKPFLRVDLLWKNAQLWHWKHFAVPVNTMLQLLTGLVKKLGHLINGVPKYGSVLLVYAMAKTHINKPRSIKT